MINATNKIGQPTKHIQIKPSMMLCQTWVPVLAAVLIVEPGFQGVGVGVEVGVGVTVGVGESGSNVTSIVE